MELGVTIKATEANPVVGDLWLSAGGAVVLEDTVSLATQRAFVSLNFFKGEWALDLDLGVPYFEYLLYAPPRQAIVFALITKALLADERVEAVEDLTYEFDKSTRRLEVSCKLRLVDGETADVSGFGVDPRPGEDNLIFIEDPDGCRMFDGGGVIIHEGP